MAWTDHSYNYDFRCFMHNNRNSGVRQNVKSGWNVGHLSLNKFGDVIPFADAFIDTNDDTNDFYDDCDDDDDEFTSEKSFIVNGVYIDAMILRKIRNEKYSYINNYKSQKYGVIIFATISGRRGGDIFYIKNNTKTIKFLQTINTYISEYISDYDIAIGIKYKNSGYPKSLILYDFNAETYINLTPILKDKMQEYGLKLHKDGIMLFSLNIDATSLIIMTNDMLMFLIPNEQI